MRFVDAPLLLWRESAPSDTRSRGIDRVASTTRSPASGLRTKPGPFLGRAEPMPPNLAANRYSLSMLGILGDLCRAAARAVEVLLE